MDAKLYKYNMVYKIQGSVTAPIVKYVKANPGLTGLLRKTLNDSYCNQ